MIDDIFFKENLYGFLLKNDSMFKKYITNSIMDYSYFYSKQLLMEIKLEHNYDLYLEFKKMIKFKIFQDIYEYLELVENYLENEKMVQSHFLFENGERQKVKKSKISKMCGFKFNNNSKIKVIKESFKKPIYTSDTLSDIFKNIIANINKNLDLKYRIIVENYDEYLYLINYIYRNNIKINFNEYTFLKDTEIYNKIMKYLSKNEFDKVKLAKLITVNTSDYYECFFNNFIYRMIKDFDDKEQFLFFLFMYRNFYLVKENNKGSNIVIEPIEFLSLIEDSNDFIILTHQNSLLKEEELNFLLNRMTYLASNLKVYLFNKKKLNKGFNILKIISDDK